jgi:hypothetical protein
MDIDNIKNNLRRMILEEIRADLTIGRIDDNKSPFTEEQILLFVNENSFEIDNCVYQIYTEYERDNELNKLVNPEYSQIREYLVDFISYPD